MPRIAVPSLILCHALLPPPLFSLRTLPDSPEASAGCVAPAALTITCCPYFLCDGGSAHSTAEKIHLMSHQRPLLSGRTCLPRWSQPLRKICTIPGSAPLFFFFHRRSREGKTVWTVLWGKTPARATALALILQWFSYGRAKPATSLRKKKMNLGRESRDVNV